MASSDALIARFQALHPKIINLSLGRIVALLEKLGNPHDHLPPVIHVAGTNGKGSTIAFMRAILEAGGLSVHVDTSPHLVRFNERIRLGRPPGNRSAESGGGQFVSDELLLDALERCEAANGDAPISFWELVTAAAFVLFSEQPADVLLLEVGLGGRLDATNVIARPAATIITPVSMDHAEYLGDTVEKIAAEKAGIFKRGSPAIIARQSAATTHVLVAAAEKAGAASIMVGGQDFAVHEEGGRLIYQDTEGLLDLPLPRLAGRHQVENAGTAIAGLRAAGYGLLPVATFEAGLAGADWPARLQRLKHGALTLLIPPGAELWLDGGHNADGAKVLAAAMADLHDRKAARLILVCGMLGTKDLQAVLTPFKGLAQELIAVPVTGLMPGRPPEEIANAATALGLPSKVAGSVADALQGLADRTWHEPPRILICGSLYLAGEVLAANGTPPL
ncbi:MAG: bifunctional folylpolyglutamate synthase/dihydrofolate synthase [Bosea sp. (in: a-proteobacteria)]